VDRRFWPRWSRPVFHKELLIGRSFSGQAGSDRLWAEHSTHPFYALRVRFTFRLCSPRLFGLSGTSFFLRRFAHPPPLCQMAPVTPAPLSFDRGAPDCSARFPYYSPASPCLLAPMFCYRRATDLPFMRCRSRRPFLLARAGLFPALLAFLSARPAALPRFAPVFAAPLYKAENGSAFFLSPIVGHPSLF